MSLVISNMETLGFAAEYGFQLVVGIDHAAVGRILQIVLFDVIPHFFGHFGTRQGCCADDGAREADGVIAFMKAALGLRAAGAFFAAGLAAAFAGAAFFAAGFAAGFLAGAAFLAVAIFEPP
jgi:hypothetical protein